VNKDQVKGTMDEAVGTVKRKAGEWTGDTSLQVKGIAQQVKGKLETALGNAKEAVHETSIDVEVNLGDTAKPEKDPKAN
jgi:uncharacterized protein YjbJ (UPF0337 family)